MIGDPCILQTPNSHGYLVGRKHRLDVRSEADARSLASQIIDDPQNVQAIRASVGQETSIEEMIEWLAAGLLGGHLHIFRTKPNAPVLDEPQITDIKTIVIDPPAPPPQVQTRFEVQLVDLHGNPLSGVNATVLHDGPHPQTTDGDGLITFEEGTSRSAKLTISASTTLHDALAAAADDISGAPILTEDDDVLIAYDRGELLGPLPLDADRRVTISVQPFVALGRMVGMFFDTDRDFPLPVAREAFVELRGLYDSYAPCDVLIAGHTDTSGQPDHNETLSLQRADAVRAFLTDDVDAWLEHYERNDRAWESSEDTHMLSVLDDFDTRPSGQNAIRWFQETRGLTVDGDAGPQTRRQLITEYMARDGTTLPQGTTIVTHGFGEAFPLDAQGEQLDADALDGQDDPIDRRVELFFFADSSGIRPAPGPEAYAQWRRRARHTEQHTQDLERKIAFIVQRKGDQTPLPGARVKIVVAGEERFATADNSGLVTFEDLPKGELDVEAFLVGAGQEEPPSIEPAPIEPTPEDFPEAEDDDDFEPGDPPGEPAQPVEPEDGEASDDDEED